MSRLPIVAVVGRPNVGKSTLVNRVLNQRAAVVEEKPGVTRDRREFNAEWSGRPFLLVDTGGWIVTTQAQLEADITSQASAAQSGADVVLLVVDSQVGVTEDDAAVARILRESETPVVLAANKVDETVSVSFDDLWGLGLGEPLAVSALHGRGVGDLLDRVVSLFEGDFESEEAKAERHPALAIIGRPNVGKSTLLNRLAGESRVLVSPVPGTTRDPIDVIIELDGQPYEVIDTAGIRRAARISDDTEFYSVLRARQALERSDVALLLIDATDGVTHQDQRIAEEAARSGSGLIVFLNKWDIADNEMRERCLSYLDRLDFVGWAPVMRGSALTGSRLVRLPGLVEMVLQHRALRVPTGQLNRIVRKWAGSHPPPVRKGRRPKIVYAVQAGLQPPTIVLFVSGGTLGPDYLRFIENRLRSEYELEGTPVHVLTRRRGKKRIGV